MVEEPQKKIDWEEKYQRARADYINLERRVKLKEEEFLKFANSVLILKLLPILDDLSKASRANKDEGLKLVLKNFSDVLKSEGVEEVEVRVGDKFDPNIMDGTVAEGSGDDVRVSEILRKGYKIKGKVLRPTQVNVKCQK